MKGYFGHIEDEVKNNGFFRKVLYTGEHSQLVLMTLLPMEEIGLETHADNDQFFRFESGEGTVIIGDTTVQVKDGDAVVVPAGTPHNIRNTSTTSPLKLYTLYSPAHHPEGTIHQTKAEAIAQEEAQMS